MSRRRSLRALCLEALTEWGKERLFADAIIEKTAAQFSLEGRERAFLNTVVLGVLRNLLLLDHWIGLLREGGLRPDVRWILRIGLYQILRMRVPDHAAVSETVSLARNPQERKLANAVLRRAVRELDSLEAEADSLPLSIRYSIPGFLVEKWTKRFGDESAASLCEWMGRPAPLFVRANTLNAEASAKLLAGAERSIRDPRFFRVERFPGNWIDQGLCYVQDPSTANACDLLNPSPGDTVLDACAAPGGKTFLLATQMHNEGRIYACDSSERRLEILRENAKRLGIGIAVPVLFDWLNPDPDRTAEFRGGFNAILVDAPCTNTGVMRRRVDVRWRLDENSFGAMAQTQFRIIENCLPFLRPGGKLVYSTCSLEPEENSELVARVLETHSDLRLVESRETLPFKDQVDGAYAALMIRSR